MIDPYQYRQMARIATRASRDELRAVILQAVPHCDFRLSGPHGLEGDDRGWYWVELSALTYTSVVAARLWYEKLRPALERAWIRPDRRVVHFAPGPFDIGRQVAG